MSNEIKQAEFIKAYILRLGKVSAACKDAGICRETFYHWKRTIPDFAQKLKDAVEDVADAKLELAKNALYEQLKREYSYRRKKAGGMKDNDYLAFIRLQIQLTPEGKELLGIVQPKPPIEKNDALIEAFKNFTDKIAPLAESVGEFDPTAETADESEADDNFDIDDF